MPNLPHRDRNAGWTTSLDERANDPDAWLVSSDRLNRGAEELVGTSSFSAWYLLTGLAVENLLKGLTITRISIAVDAKGRVQLPWRGSGHDLPGLAGSAGVSFSDDEKELLKRLSEFVVWGARYPIPRRLEEFKPLFLSTEDVGTARQIVKRCQDELRQRIHASDA